jgi:hypothetical protein
MPISSPNLNSVVGGLKTLVSKIPIAANQSAKIIATQILDDSLNLSPSCPEDTGRLRSTGRVEPVREGYAVVYGGMADDGTFVDYAAYVHDDLRPRKYTRPGSGPKFVETHVYRRSEEAPAKIGKILQDIADNIFKVYR